MSSSILRAAAAAASVAAFGKLDAAKGALVMAPVEWSDGMGMGERGRKKEYCPSNKRQVKIRPVGGAGGGDVDGGGAGGGGGGRDGGGVGCAKCKWGLSRQRTWLAVPDPYMGRETPATPDLSHTNPFNGARRWSPQSRRRQKIFHWLGHGPLLSLGASK